MFVCFIKKIFISITVIQFFYIYEKGTSRAQYDKITIAIKLVSSNGTYHSLYCVIYR